MPLATFVLVHGAFCNAAQWGPLTRALAVQGHRVIAVDLPGHGLDARPAGTVGLSTVDEVSVVASAVRAARALGPVVLVGHSRGGLAVTATANVVAELLDHLVYVSAWCCVDAGPSSYVAPEASAFDAVVPGLLLADPSEVGELRVDLTAAGPDVLGMLHESLLAEDSRERFQALLASMDGREAVQVDDVAVRLDPERAGIVPRTYVRLPADRALSPVLQDRFIAEADAVTPTNPFTVVDLASSHLGVLLDPEPLAEVLSTRRVCS
jgi:pimeloyl-ACP methyl ester carboxylesterase